MWDSINLAKIKPILFIVVGLTVIWGLRPDLAQAQEPIQIGCTDRVGDVAGLIAAIENANSQSGQDTIILAENCFYTLLTSYNSSLNGLPLISDDLIIEGNGATIQRHPLAPPFRLLEIDTVQMTIRHLTLRAGLLGAAQGGGGAIYAQNTVLVLEEVTLLGNQSQFGGAVAVLGDSTTLIKGSLFDNNHAAPGGGGGLYTKGSLQVSENSRFAGNTAHRDGGSIAVDLAAETTISDSSFTENKALTGSGGGLHATGPLTVNQTEFISNTARIQGGGVNSTGNKTLIIKSHFLSNQTNKYAGAFHTTSPQVEVSQSTFIQNSAAEEGGAIISKGKSVLSDNRFIKNKAFEGAGLMLISDETNRLINNLWVDNESDTLPDTVVIELVGNGTVVMHHNTIVSHVPRNHGAVGIVRGELQAHNNIVVNYSRSLSPRPGSQTPPLVISTHNLFHGHTPDELTTGNNNIEADPMFVDPANDDFHLQADSPAIDKGLDVGVSIDLDGRPRPVGEGFDIGAYEFDPSPGSNGGFTVYLPLVVK